MEFDIQEDLIEGTSYLGAKLRAFEHCALSFTHNNVVSGLQGNSYKHEGHFELTRWPSPFIFS